MYEVLLGEGVTWRLLRYTNCLQTEQVAKEHSLSDYTADRQCCVRGGLQGGEGIKSLIRGYRVITKETAKDVVQMLNPRKNNLARSIVIWIGLN